MENKDNKENKTPVAPLQEIKEKFITQDTPVIDNALVRIPDLKISEEDKDRFVDSLASGEPYVENFTLAVGKGLSIQMRDKTKKEGDIISRKLDQMHNDGQVLSAVEYGNLYNIACLYYQLQTVNGVVQNRAYPENIWKIQDFDLFGIIDQSFIGGLTSSSIFVFMAAMNQMNKKLFRLAAGVFDAENFSLPAKGS